MSPKYGDGRGRTAWTRSINWEKALADSQRSMKQMRDAWNHEYGWEKSFDTVGQADSVTVTMESWEAILEVLRQARRTVAVRDSTYLQRSIDKLDSRLRRCRVIQDYNGDESDIRTVVKLLKLEEQLSARQAARSEKMDTGGDQHEQPSLPG